jgi:hypothetical protein
MMDIFSTNTTATSSDNGLGTATNLRVASLSIAAYEYVSSCVSPPLSVTHIRPAISLPFLWNIGCTSPIIETSKKIAASFWRYSLDLYTLHTRLRLLILFILIRHVCSTLSFETCSHRFCRYCSITVLVLSNVGFFYRHFSEKFCHHYFRVIPVFKRWCYSSALICLEVERFCRSTICGVTNDPRSSVNLDCLVSRIPSPTMSSRTYSISRFKVWVRWTVLLAYFIAVGVRCHHS